MPIQKQQPERPTRQPAFKVLARLAPPSIPSKRQESRSTIPTPMRQPCQACGIAKARQLAYHCQMKAIFFETTIFTSKRPEYLAESDYRLLQNFLLDNPKAGDLMPRTGGFRKMRWNDKRRKKGTRGGLRVIYCWLEQPQQFWMFTLYDKDEMENLTPDQERLLKKALADELRKRGIRDE